LDQLKRIRGVGEFGTCVYEREGGEGQERERGEREREREEVIPTLKSRQRFGTIL
jgi:hypothetical protein